MRSCEGWKFSVGGWGFWMNVSTFRLRSSSSVRPCVIYVAISIRKSIYALTTHWVAGMRSYAFIWLVLFVMLTLRGWSEEMYFGECSSEAIERKSGLPGNTTIGPLEIFRERQKKSSSSSPGPLKNRPEEKIYFNNNLALGHSIFNVDEYILQRRKLFL